MAWHGNEGTFVLELFDIFHFEEGLFIVAKTQILFLRMLLNINSTPSLTSCITITQKPQFLFINFFRQREKWSTSAISLYMCAHTNTWSYWNKYFMDTFTFITEHSYVSFIVFILAITIETLTK